MDVGGSPRECRPDVEPLFSALLLLLLLLNALDNFRRKSSRSKDFNGDTLISDGRGKLLEVAPLSSRPLLLGSCFIGMSEIDGVIVSSLPPTFLE